MGAVLAAHPNASEGHPEPVEGAPISNNLQLETNFNDGATFFSQITSYSQFWPEDDG
jgi:hypothetical protein